LSLFAATGAISAAVCAEEPPAKKSKATKQAAGIQHGKKQHKSAAAGAGAEDGKEAAHKHKHSKHHHKHKKHSNADADAEEQQKHNKKKAGAGVKKDSRPHYGDMTGPSEDDVWQSDDSDNVVRAACLGFCLRLGSWLFLNNMCSDSVVRAANFHLLSLRLQITRVGANCCSGVYINAMCSSACSTYGGLLRFCL
jgi:hypothetical protein